MRYPRSMNTSTDATLLTVSQAADALGITDRAVRKRLEAGTLAGQSIAGVVWVIPASEIARAKANPPRRGRPWPAKLPRQEGSAQR